MKAFLLLLSLLLVSRGFAANEVAFSIPSPTPASDQMLLAAIAEVETSNNSAKVGTHGERTRLQIAPTTWARFSRLPHSAAASHPEETDRVARVYLAYIRTRLKSRGVPETPFFIAAAWNVGPGWKTLPSSTVSYAERVANLVQASQSIFPSKPESRPAPALVLSKPVPTIVVEESPAIEPMTFTLPTTRPLFRLADSN